MVGYDIELVVLNPKSIDYLMVYTTEYRLNSKQKTPLVSHTTEYCQRSYLGCNQDNAIALRALPHYWYPAIFNHVLSPSNEVTYFSFCTCT